jgi:hypothetical protein
MRRLLMAVGVFGLATVGLVQSVAPAEAVQTGTVTITAPMNGATLSGPVAVQVAVGGVTVKPATDGDPAAFHHHVLVDVDPATVVQTGQPLPTGQANIIHTHEPVTLLNNLPPGPHTITVILTKTDHVPLSPSVSARVQFTVAAAGQTPPAASPTPLPAMPRTGTGAGGDGQGIGLGTMLPLVMAATFAAGALLLRRRSRV